MKPLKSHCKHGHEMTPENTYVNTAGARCCKICLHSIKQKAWKKKRESVGKSYKARATHCKHGHELTPENIYKDPSQHRHCRICRAAATERIRPTLKQRRAARTAKLRELNPRYTLASRLKYSYGLTLEDYDHMVAEQNGLCAICHKPETEIDWHSGKIRNFHIDHDHETGEVRGLLCSLCNKGIGQLGDSIEILESAITYLKRRRKHHEATA